jgi:hypothetical protein
LKTNTDKYEYDFLKDLIKKRIKLEFNTQNDNNQSNYSDFENTIQNAYGTINVMENVINTLDNINLDDTNSVTTAIKKINKIRNNINNGHLYSSIQRSNNINTVPVISKKTENTEEQHTKPNYLSSDSTVKNKTPRTHEPLTPAELEKQKKKEIREEKVQERKKDSVANKIRYGIPLQTEGGNRLKNNHNKSIKKPKNNIELL